MTKEGLKKQIIKLLEGGKEMPAWDLHNNLTKNNPTLQVEETITALQELALDEKIAVGFNGFSLK